MPPEVEIITLTKERKIPGTLWLVGHSRPCINRLGGFGISRFLSSAREAQQFDPSDRLRELKSENALILKVRRLG